MDQQAEAADGIAEAADSGDHIQQQGRTESLSFMAFVDAQTGKQGDGLARHARHAPGVIGNDVGLIHLGDDKHPGGACPMGLLGHLHQPGGLLLGAAAEAFELVTGRQQLWRLVAAHAWG